MKFRLEVKEVTYTSSAGGESTEIEFEDGYTLSIPEPCESIAFGEKFDLILSRVLVADEDRKEEVEPCPTDGWKQ